MKARNPNTGTLETVYVKALDSMPVGTEVDFTGSVSDIPAGWEQVSGKTLVAYDLWTNPNPTSEFGAQNVEINLTDMKYIDIFYTRWEGTTTLFQRIVFNNTTTYTQLVYCDYDSGTTRAWNRIVTIRTDKILFNVNQINGATANKGLIPYKIVGYKEV